MIDRGFALRETKDARTELELFDDIGRVVIAGAEAPLEENVMSEINEFVGRYVAVWNERDADRRRKGIAELWAEDGAHFTQSLEARGYEAIEARVTGAHERFVVTEGFVFRSANNADGHHNVVKFNWEMVPAGGGPVAGAGFDFFVLDDDGRIKYDYQFPAPVPAT